MRKYLGVTAIAIICITLIICKLENPAYSIYLNTLSTLGANPPTDNTFNLGLLITAAIFGIYIRHMLKIYRVPGKLFKLVSITFYAVAISILGVGLFSLAFNKIIHSFFASVLFLSIIFGLLIFGLAIQARYSIMALISIIFGILVFVSGCFALKIFGLTGVSQGICLLELFSWLFVILYHSLFKLSYSRHQH